MTDGLRSIPSVDKVLQALGPGELPRATVTAVVRRELARVRDAGEVPTFESILAAIQRSIWGLLRTRLRPVINATGILVHTNLGRAPLTRAAVNSISQVAERYSNLEYDLHEGERGGRAKYLESQLALLCQAEAATAVNNGAAALVLALRHFTQKQREVIISRGELVQIGGGFRIPEILQASGAHLREVGTTNQTSLMDYANAVGPDTGLILKVHRSNFYMDGFVASPQTEELATLALDKQVPLVEDLGSGAMLSTERFAGLEHEPTPAEVLKHGVDLVIFSGDKLFGGPQAGIIAGRARWIVALKQEPFFRAVRCDKLVLAGLEATVDEYLADAPGLAVPVVQMLATSEKDLRARAERICTILRAASVQGSVGSGEGRVGGGTLPRSKFASVTLDLTHPVLPVKEFARRLRERNPAVIGYVAEGQLKLDLRTVFPDQDSELTTAVIQSFQAPTP